jgi:hypothetical protein
MAKLYLPDVAKVPVYIFGTEVLISEKIGLPYTISAPGAYILNG